MGLRRISVSGLPELMSSIEALKSSGNKVYVLFCGTTDPETGHSWCSDCVKGKPNNTCIITTECISADPVIEKVASEQSNGVLIQCSVGDKPT